MSWVIKIMVSAGGCDGWILLHEMVIEGGRYSGVWSWFLIVMLQELESLPWFFMVDEG